MLGVKREEIKEEDYAGRSAVTKRNQSFTGQDKLKYLDKMKSLTNLAATSKFAPSPLRIN